MILTIFLSFLKTKGEMKFDLTDTTFIIPIRADTVVRLENLS